MFSCICCVTFNELLTAFQKMRRELINIHTHHAYISVAKRQNTVPLYLVKLRNRALKFLVHFSLVCLAKYPKPHEKWLPMGQGIWGVHFPSFRHALEAIWGSFSANFATKTGFQKPISLYFLHLWNVKTRSRCKRVAIAMGTGFDVSYPNSKGNGNVFSIRVLCFISK